MMLATIILAAGAPQACPLPTSWNMDVSWEAIPKPYEIVAQDPDLGIRIGDFGVTDAATLTQAIDYAGGSLRVVVLDTSRGNCFQLMTLASAVSAARPCTPQICYAVAVPEAARPVPRSRKRAPIPVG